MKRTLRKLLTVAVLSVAMAFSMIGCGAEQADADGIDPEYVARLEQECVDLRNQLQVLTNQIGDLEQSVVLKSYTLKAIPNEAGTGATVEIAAAPTRYQDEIGRASCRERV